MTINKKLFKKSNNPSNDKQIVNAKVPVGTVYVNVDRKIMHRNVNVLLVIVFALCLLYLSLFLFSI